MLRDQAVSRRRRGQGRRARAAATSEARPRKLPSFRFLLRAVPGMVYLIVLILAAWLLYYSVNYPYFVVREIFVSGNRLLDSEQARDATGSLGQNLLLLRTRDIEESVQRISVVQKAQASLTMTGQLEVSVSERSPMVRWQSRGDAFLVDRSGLVFSREAPSSSVPVVREVNGPDLEVGSRIDTAVLDTVSALETMLPSRLGIKPVWYDYIKGSGVAVPVEGGPRIIFGDAEELDAKVAAFDSIQQHLDATQTRAEVVDLRFSGRPTYVLPLTPVPTKASVKAR